MRINAKKENIVLAQEYVEETLKKYKVSEIKIQKALFSLEEVLVHVISKSRSEAQIEIQVKKVFGSVSIKVKSVGEPLDKSEMKAQMMFDGELTEEESIIVNNLIEKTIGDTIHIKSSRGINRCHIDAAKVKMNSLAVVFGALILGLLVGVVLKGISPDFATMASDNLFTPIYTMFLNALKMIVGPLVFISIANSVLEFDDIKTLGKIAGKVLGLYVFTSVIAIGVGFLTYKIFPIGDTALQSAVTDAADETISASAETNTSLLDMIVNIIPTDVITPFMEMNMLQVIFMAILLGIATALVGKGTAFAEGLSNANTIVLKVTEIVIAFLPLSIFCSMAKLIISMDFASLMDVIVWVPVCYAGHISMLIVYAILLLVLARMNPLKFLKAYYPAMITAFATSSSNATMPISMERCNKGLHISPKVYAFSIPFGATVNMDGNCITLVITTLFMAKTFGIVITAGMVATLVLTILALSMGSPGIPGGGIVCMTIIFPMIGVPAEAVSLVMALYCLIGMTQTVANVTGDAVVTTIVAKSEKMIDMDAIE